MTVYNDKTGRASFRQDTLAHDTLIAGPRAIEAKKMTLVSGSVLRGAVLGRVLGAAIAAAVAGNVGNGAFGAVTLGAGVKPGVYRVTYIEPASNAGAFVVEDPDGIEVGHGTTAVAFAGPINFTIADGATDFVAGDSFTVTVALSDNDVKLAAAAAVDGSAIPIAIAAQDADATGGEVEILTYIYGDFSEDALSFGAGHTADTVRAPLRALGIHLVDVLPN